LCELIAYRLVEQFNQQVEMNAIKNNLYTRGQFALFLEADNTYGFYTVMQWMKWGADSGLRKKSRTASGRSTRKSRWRHVL